MTIDTLPQDIFQLIQTLLTNDDYHYFLNSSKRLFGDLKRKTIFFKLTKERSIEYAKNTEFQHLLLSKVENGWNQIGIICSDSFGTGPKNILASRDIPIDLPICNIYGNNAKLPFHLWNNYKSINCELFLSGVCEIPPFPNVKDLHLLVCTSPYADTTPMIDLRGFSHLSSLHINDLKVKDIASLKDIPCLSLSGCKEITDFSVLSNQKELRLSSCPGLTDVKSFREIRKLNLFDCSNISDVSSLKGVYDLTIQACSNIKDVSCLGNHHRLSLSGIWSGFDALLHIPHVHLMECFIENVSVLRFAKSVYLYQCPKIDSVNPLKTVKKVILINSGKSGFTELAKVPDLFLSLHDEFEFAMN